jgi:hypothetical protein
MLAGIINPHCAECPIYAAGSLGAVQLMTVERPHKRDELCFDAVPEGSLVLVSDHRAHDGICSRANYFPPFAILRSKA